MAFASISLFVKCLPLSSLFNLSLIRGNTANGTTGLVDFVTKRFSLYDDYQKGVPESVQVWSTINHVQGELKQKLHHNRDTSREAFLERCRLLENGDEDDEENDDETESESESEDTNETAVEKSPVIVPNKAGQSTSSPSSPILESDNVEKSPANESNDSGNISDQATISIGSMAASESSGNLQNRGTKRPAVEEEPEVIVIEDSDDEQDEEIDVNLMYAIKSEARPSNGEASKRRKL